MLLNAVPISLLAAIVFVPIAVVMLLRSVRQRRRKAVVWLAGLCGCVAWLVIDGYWERFSLQARPIKCLSIGLACDEDRDVFDRTIIAKRRPTPVGAVHDCFAKVAVALDHAGLSGIDLRSLENCSSQQVFFLIWVRSSALRFSGPARLQSYFDLARQRLTHRSPCAGRTEPPTSCLASCGVPAPGLPSVVSGDGLAPAVQDEGRRYDGRSHDRRRATWRLSVLSFSKSSRH